jgi:hypothetical protein
VDLLCRSALRRWRLSFGRPGVPGVDLWKGNEEGGASRSTDDEEGESSPPSVVSVGVALDFFRRRFRLGLMTCLHALSEETPLSRCAAYLARSEAMKLSASSK